MYGGIAKFQLFATLALEFIANFIVSPWYLSTSTFNLDIILTDLISTTATSNTFSSSDSVWSKYSHYYFDKPYKSVIENEFDIFTLSPHWIWSWTREIFDSCYNVLEWNEN